MEPQSLEAASTYINNLLLARGLLKNGKPIDFARPEEGPGGTDGTMARIINLVNDLVVRRDREAEHRENLATTIRMLRANESQQTVEIEKLKTKNSDLKRSLALAEGQERTFKTNMRSAESTIRGLKENVQRMKTTIQQIRAQCANDVRKRDIELQRLKSHLTDRQRGKREGLGVTTININPASDRSLRSKTVSSDDSVNNPGYSLKQETTEFLTELCQNLSDENDTLISLSRNTIRTLKELQGLSGVEEGNGDAPEVSIMTSHSANTGPVTALPTSYEELSSEMEVVLDHLRNLLTNPSFVPLEEVEIRDEEIQRLREDWERMEIKWKQAVRMMDGWHKRLSDGGDSFQAAELKIELGIGSDMNSVKRSVNEGLQTNSTPPIYEEEQESEGEEEKDEEEAVPESISRDDTPSTNDSALPVRKPSLQPSRALGERNRNISSKSPRKVSFHADLIESSQDQGKEEDETIPVKAHKSGSVTQRPTRRRVEPKSRHGTNPRHMSVSEKLAAVEAEAHEALEARKQEESRKRSRALKDSSKRRRERRRSTLTSDELDELMGVPSL
ncbi:Afadin and alpha-actinin-binding-domain-containing protein [Paecilomyces variotii]|uniref:Afadin and alpha-actinin-binding-domain-containing protein n=1 Tax=Byssochlamys spectabilis TaxID=264951 RepID=A0A443HMG4_BYSSP|nr:Afadin and alpha-actinin-binding-domain-containing protein [Paecilomyces variotii]KAJ9237132.1 hypothetical protein DTO169E5_5327 [Paecilomyces variotii]KAJ9261105.1 hypothetical protein DTO207G8_255 [Paecilomyces variotii]KAJ9305582.1 hypothetical protein DTO217A2_4981 [Paecilomyces variotii]KAJ9351199.1 hypothetical protein DTO280E4_8345 [Paecilomyces variotii]KAJ9393001.1 hypothetical protein DTO063F5_138 [Paecilomyces variotii]